MQPSAQLAASAATMRSWKGWRLTSTRGSIAARSGSLLVSRCRQLPAPAAQLLPANTRSCWRPARERQRADWHPRLGWASGPRPGAPNKGATTAALLNECHSNANSHVLSLLLSSKCTRTCPDTNHQIASSADVQFQRPRGCRQLGTRPQGAKELPAVQPRDKVRHAQGAMTTSWRTLCLSFMIQPACAIAAPVAHLSGKQTAIAVRH